MLVAPTRGCTRGGLEAAAIEMNKKETIGFSQSAVNFKVCCPLLLYNSSAGVNCHHGESWVGSELCCCFSGRVGFFVESNKLWTFPTAKQKYC